MLYPNIVTIITDNPKTQYSQKELSFISSSSTENSNIQQKIQDIYANSKITSRYLDSLDFYNKNKNAKIDERLASFKTAATDIIVNLVKTAFKQSNLTNQDIHKIIFVSSTGILAPSIDVEIIKKLKLPNTTDRSNIFFMGCAAGVIGMKNAYEYLQLDANKNKNVLLICAELSSVHIHFSEDINNIITHSIFSDGLAVVILSSTEQKNDINNTVSVVDTFNYLVDNTEDGITLSINEYAISCTLSKNLPKYIRDNISIALHLFLEKNNLSFSDIDFWAVHPGGKRIIESVQTALQLTDKQTQVSWDILDNYGNMLSASIMFVLKEFINNNNNIDKKITYCVAFSFSPGVGIEFVLLKKHIV